MPAEPLVTIDDLAARVGPIPSSAQTRAMACIQDASALVRAEAGPTGASWNLTSTPPDVAAVILAVAGRVYRNPEGLVSQTVGPITQTRAANSVSAYLTAYERGIVRRSAGRSTLTTVQVTRGDTAPALRERFLPVADGSGEPVEWVAEWEWAP